MQIRLETRSARKVSTAAAFGRSIETCPRSYQFRSASSPGLGSAFNVAGTKDQVGNFVRPDFRLAPDHGRAAQAGAAEAPIVQAIIGLTTLLSLDSLHPQLGKSL